MHTPSSLAPWARVSAAHACMVVSEPSTGSQLRSAVALELAPSPSTGSSLGLLSFQRTLHSSAFPRPWLLQACESVRVGRRELSL